MTTRLEKAIPLIENFLNQQGKKIFSYQDLTAIRNDPQWNLPAYLKVQDFIYELLEKEKIKEIKISSENYAPLKKYIRGNPSPYEIALSMKKDAYLTHSTAVFLHGLNDHVPNSIYVNKEQSKKPEIKSDLSQLSINRAFSKEPRKSNYIFKFENHKITVLSGKNTENLEVIPVSGPNGETLLVTTIARTLIDIAVRPHYSGGIFQVLAAYKGAKERAGVNAIMAILKKLDYKYPYHQAIGFLLSRAGYHPKRLEKIKSIGLAYDFYLDYAIPEKNKVYDSEWRLFYPKGI